MNRSRLALLAVVAPVAACSTRNNTSNSVGTAALSQDTSLANVGLRTDAALRSLPKACGTVAVATQPAGVDRQRAEVLTRQAYDSELVGKVPQARVLLHRASELDATNTTTAYHLGRTSETLGDSAGAVTAYCHFLALAPTAAETNDARQRLARLSQPRAQGVTASGVTTTPTRQRTAYSTTRRVARRRATAPSYPVSVATTARPDGASSSTSGTRSVSSEAGGAADLPPSAPQQPATVSSTAPSAHRRAPSRAEGAGIGAGIGAIIGVAAGRSVKGVLIGAAAGGILGSVVAGPRQ